MNLRDRMLARLDQPRNRKWYEIRNATDADRATVRIYDEIGYWGVTAQDLANEIAEIDAGEIEVQINSPGGDVFDGLAIYNALRMHPAKITTRVDGLAASAASVIVQAGDHRVMVKSAQMMIHEAWGVAVGPAAVMREFADLLEQQNDVIADIYATRSGGEVDDFKTLMAAETWLTDQGAIDVGLADELHQPAGASARLDQPPHAAAAAGAAGATPPVLDETEAFDPERLGLLARAKVREMFGSSALAGNHPSQEE